MPAVISVFFNIDRVYLTLVETSDKGVSLEYINSTDYPVDINNPKSGNSPLAVEQLRKIFSEFGTQPDRVTVTLPAEVILVNKFPGNESLTEEQIKKLVSLELKQNYPQVNFEEFKIYVVPLTPGEDGKEFMLAVIVQRDDFMQIEQILSPIGIDITHFDISQLNAHSAFIFNYPEYINSTVAIAGIQGQFMDFSVIKKGEPLYYNLALLQEPENAGEVFESQFNNVVPDIASKIDASFFFGAGLTKTISDSLTKSSRQLGIEESKRLNGFRKLRTNLNDRVKDYCSRVFHIYPPCIGGSLPNKHKIIELD
jgi:hypothetical protein